MCWPFLQGICTISKDKPNTSQWGAAKFQTKDLLHIHTIQQTIDSPIYGATGGVSDDEQSAQPTWGKRAAEERKVCSCASFTVLLENNVALRRTFSVLSGQSVLSRPALLYHPLWTSAPPQNQGWDWEQKLLQMRRHPVLNYPKSPSLQNWTYWLNCTVPAFLASDHQMAWIC